MKMLAGKPAKTKPVCAVNESTAGTIYKYMFRDAGQNTVAFSKSVAIIDVLKRSGSKMDFIQMTEVAECLAPKIEVKRNKLIKPDEAAFVEGAKEGTYVIYVPPRITLKESMKLGQTLKEKLAAAKTMLQNRQQVAVKLALELEKAINLLLEKEKKQVGDILKGAAAVHRYLVGKE